LTITAGAREGVAAARRAAEHSPRWRERRVAGRESMAAAAELADAELRWRSYIVPEAARLQTVLDGRTRSVEVLSAENARQVERSRR
jgi:hypothetical protein